MIIEVVRNLKNGSFKEITFLNIFKYLFVPQLIFYISIRNNKGFTLDAHSLGKNLQYYSNIFPEKDLVFQPQRVLLPLLGKIFNVDIQVINIIILLILNFLIFNFLQKKVTLTSTILFLLCLNFTMFFQFHINFGGYPDILSYFFLFITYTYRRKKLIPYIAFFFALLTKETVVFTIFFYLSLKEISKFKFFSTVILYLPIYFTLSIGKFGPSFYIEPIITDILYWLKIYNNNLIIGIFSSVKFLWLLIIYYFVTKPSFKSLPVYLLLGGIILQFIFSAADTTRFASFIFLGLIYLFEEPPKKLEPILFFIFILNTITPKYYVYAGVNDNLLVLNQMNYEILNLHYYLNQYLNF